MHTVGSYIESFTIVFRPKLSVDFQEKIPKENKQNSTKKCDVYSAEGPL